MITPNPEGDVFAESLKNHGIRLLLVELGEGERLDELRKYLNATLEEFQSLVESAGDFDDTRVGNGWTPSRIEESLSVLPAMPAERLLKALKPSGLSGLRSLIGKVRSRPVSQIDIRSSKLMYIPYWFVQGFHECYFFRTASYKVPTNQDVVAVEVDGTLKNLVLQDSKPSTLVGALRLRLDRLAGMITNAPRYFLLDGVTELARNYREATLFLDRFGRIDHKREQLMKSKPPTRRFQGHEKLQEFLSGAEVAPMEISKEAAVMELHKKVVSPPSCFTRILTNRFEITQLTLVHLPILRVEYSYDGDLRTTQIDGYSGGLLRNHTF